MQYLDYRLILIIIIIIISDIPVTETQTDRPTEMIDISKTDTVINTEKIFNTDTIYIQK